MHLTKEDVHKDTVFSERYEEYMKQLKDRQKGWRIHKSVDNTRKKAKKFQVLDKSREILRNLDYIPPYKYEYIPRDKETERKRVKNIENQLRKKSVPNMNEISNILTSTRGVNYNDLFPDPRRDI